MCLHSVYPLLNTCRHVHAPAEAALQPGSGAAASRGPGGQPDARATTAHSAAAERSMKSPRRSSLSSSAHSHSRTVSRLTLTRKACLTILTPGLMGLPAQRGLRVMTELEAFGPREYLQSSAECAAGQQLLVAGSDIIKREEFVGQ